MRKIYDLAVKTREYTDKSGNTKANWDNVGSIVENDRGGRFMFLKKSFNPAGVPMLGNARPDSDSIIVSMFEPRDDNGGGGYRGRGNGGRRDDRDSRDDRDDRGGSYRSRDDGGGRGRRDRGRDDDRDIPLDFASYEDRGFDFKDGPSGMGRDEADVPF